MSLVNSTQVTISKADTIHWGIKLDTGVLEEVCTRWIF